MSKPIRSVSQYRYDVLENGLADNIEDWSEFIQTKTEYNSNDMVLKEITYGSWGEPDQIIEYLYDENNILMEEKYFHGDDEASEIVIYHRDANQNILKESHQFLDGSEDVTEYKYNDRDQLISKMIINDDGETERKETYNYSGEQLISEIFEEFLSNNVIQNSYTYNSDGIVIESEQIIKEENRSERLVNQFDDTGKRIKTLKYNHQDKLIEINRFSYKDDRLDEIEEETQRGKFFIKFSYDDKGNITNQEEINDKGEIISTIERDFTDDGQLLQATVYIDGMNYRPNQHYIIRYEYEFFD
ncbi:MAG: hypothetical protein AB9842_12105 [Bacteroidales bacterium]